jgi:hypothetical protein
MSDLTIFMVGVFASTLCLTFLITTVLELKRVGRAAEAVKTRSMNRD